MEPASRRGALRSSELACFLRCSQPAPLSRVHARLARRACAPDDLLLWQLPA
jgi:hypothetical protein